MSLPSGVAALRHSANASAAVVLPDGRGWAVLLARPGSRTSSRHRLSRIPSNGSGFHKRRHGREHFPLASHRGGSFYRLPASIGRPGLTMDATRASRRQTGGPCTSHCRGPVSSDTRTASRIARRMRAYVLRPGAGSAVKSGARPSEALLPFVSFLLSLPDRQRVLPRSHSKGSTFFIARRPVLGGMLGRGCFTPTPIQPSQLILSLTSPGRSSIPPIRPTCIFID